MMESKVNVPATYDRKDLTFELKSVNENGYFEGMASIFGVVDLGGDLVEKGAFTKTLQENGGQVVILYQHDSDEPIGIGQVEEVDRGLFIRGQLELQLQKAKDAYVRLKGGLMRGLSIGYRSIPSRTEIIKGVRHLKELILYEVSVVTLPMNPQALVEAVKAGTEPSETKGAVSFQNWPIAESLGRRWDGSAADKRARAWVGGALADWTAAQWAKYRRLHLWFDPAKRDQAGGYKFLLVDIIDGEPTYVWNGVRAALAILRGGRGVNVSGSDWASDVTAMESHVKKIYRKFGKPFPAKGAEPEETKMDFDTALDMVETYEARWQMLSALRSSLDSTLYSDQLEPDEKVSESEASIAQFGERYVELLPRLLALLAESSHGMMSATVPEIKVERGSAEHQRLERAVKFLQALLPPDDAAPVGTLPGAGAATQDSSAPDPSHSLLKQLIAETTEMTT